MPSPAVTDRLPTTRGMGVDAWRYAGRRALHGFMRHRGLDSAASLTFFAILALFPVTLILVSSFALADGDTTRGVSRITEIADDFLTEQTVDSMRELLTTFSKLPTPGIALGVGIALSIWSMGSYATSFGRAIDSVYEVQEGRPFWRFRAGMTVVAIALLALFALMAALLLTTPTVADAVGTAVGLSRAWVVGFNIVKWPVLLGLAVISVGIIYYFTPNVKHVRLRWVSWGASLAIVACGAATAIFGTYVLVFNTYEHLYGWLGSAIALILWLYIANLLLVLGAEVDAELVRVRQLAAGIEAEVSIRLPLRDTARNRTLARQQTRDEREGRAMRERANPPA